MGDWGIKVALPGIDVREATLEETMFSSGHSSPKIDMTQTPKHYGDVKVNFVNAPPDAAVTEIWRLHHGLGYKPMVLASYEFFGSDGFSSYTFEGVMPFAPTATLEIRLYVDDQDIILKAYQEFVTWISPAAGNYIKLSYYIFAEPIQ